MSAGCDLSRTEASIGIAIASDCLSYRVDRNLSHSVVFFPLIDISCQLNTYIKIRLTLHDAPSAWWDPHASQTFGGGATTLTLCALLRPQDGKVNSEMLRDPSKSAG